MTSEVRTLLRSWLDRLAPDGIDLNFENVGGDIMIAVFNRLKTHGRMAVCGLISAYNATRMPPSPNFSRIITHRLNVQGFLVLDYAHRAREMVAEMGPWLHEINAPSQVLTGELDGGCNPRLNTLIAKAMPNAELVVMPGLKHAIFIEATDQVLPHVRRFLLERG